MDFDDTPDEAAWRTEVRSFLDRHAPGPDQPRAWQATLYDAGFVGVTWPVEAGGRGGTPMQQAIVDQETARRGLPPLINLIGIGMCGPTVIVHGSERQRQRYLKRLLRADDLWCQLFSEPAAGSDLAALRTRAVRDGDGWRVSGQKVWTTLAHLADFGILLTRTDPDVPKHRGLTMFVVDMKAPGVTVRPLRQMNGDAHFNEVFFDDVRIPDDERLGDVGDGWRVALTTLMSERLSLGGGGTSIGPKPEAVARHVARHIGALPEDRRALARQELGRGYVAALGARYTGYRQLSRLNRGELPGPEASAGKLSGTRSARDLTDLAVRVLGPDAATGDDGEWQNMQAMLPGMAIAGGSDQVLRNIIGERVLGLPAEPRADKGVTFRESLG
ncbi:acyl-CoA dehydrogenase family protein [Actinoplanes flavus]|uniref:Acyl-CoA dehydrogenase family protein n=1 Tax=Actinoplanes flavus TaxID=2820290 RepID=A0ABS3UVV6_9ACTN|nr:acyl-CoA dehydrogenase family protein [Actinoplanes flavus]MBO3742694.1 acyl-CoA dehydrogenase family protein [Actinoplanes flavus]